MGGDWSGVGGSKINWKCVKETGGWREGAREGMSRHEDRKCWRVLHE